MACHLSHKLPWDIIDELVMLFPENNPTHQKVRLSPSHEKKLAHFSRCLASALNEFAESDRTTDEEWRFFNPHEWENQRPYGIGGWTGFYESLPVGYIILNVILMDPERFERHCRDGTVGGNDRHFLQILLGSFDGHHPRAFADHLGQVFSRLGDPCLIKPLTAERLDIIKRHAGWIFRSMYAIGSDNRLLDPDDMTWFLKSYYFAI